MIKKPVKQDDDETSDVRETLRSLANRILRAANRGTGTRITKEEARLLRFYNLPYTADDPSIAGDTVEE